VETVETTKTMGRGKSTGSKNQAEKKNRKTRKNSGKKFLKNIERNGGKLRANKKASVALPEPSILY